MGLKLVENWQRGHRMLSNQLVVVDGALLVAWTQVPPDLKAAIPTHWLAVAAGTWLAIKVAARLIDQGSTTAPPEGPTP